MARGRKTGGRKKGTRNKATTEARAAAEANGILPLDYMLAVMRDPEASTGRRDGMAMAAAPYLHPKLSALNGIEMAAKFNPAGGKEKQSSLEVRFVVPTPRDEDDLDG